MAYLSQTKKGNGILIKISDTIKYYISWKDLELLKEGKYLSKSQKPVIVLNSLPTQEEIKE